MSPATEPAREGPTERRRLRAVAFAAALAWFAVAVSVLGDFGPTWDVAIGSYPYGEKVLAWLASDVDDFVEFAGTGELLETRQPAPAISGAAFEWFQVYPVGATLSALSARVLWHELGLVPALVARHLVVPAAVAVLVWALVVFLARRASLTAAVGAVALLVTSPRFFTHGLTNLKDAPEAVFYTLALLAIWRVLVEGTARAWVLLGIATALALAQKANGLFLPLHACVLAIARVAVDRRRLEVRWRGLLAGAAAFVAVYLAVSPALWHDPIARVGRMLGQAQAIGSTGALDELLEPRRGWMVRLSPALNAVLTTPPTVLALALVGVFSGSAPRFLRAFLAVGALFPIVRLLVPGVRDFDGVRHFLEFYPSTCALAGIGLAACLARAARFRGTAAAAVRAALVAVALAPGVAGTVRTYPYGTCYFNALVGGLGGAQAAGVPQATDYWAASYWHGAAWLSEHAEPGAGLVVPVAPQVVEVLAPLRLRDDIVLEPRTPDACDGPVYVMYVTRRDFYDVVRQHLDATEEPLYEVTVQGGTILRIHRFEGAERKRELFALLDEQRAFLVLRGAFVRWLRQDPANPALVRDAMAREADGDRSEAVRRLRAALPATTDEQARRLVEWLAGIAI